MAVSPIFHRSISYSFETGHLGAYCPAYNSRWDIFWNFYSDGGSSCSCLYSLLIGVFVNRTIKLKDIPSILLRSGVTAGAIMFVLGTVSAFGYVITREGIPQQLTVAATSAVHSPLVFLIIVQFILIIAGMFMNGSAVIILLAPILYPTIIHYGIDPVLLWRFDGSEPCHRHVYSASSSDFVRCC